MTPKANLPTGSTKCTWFSWCFSEWALITFKCAKIPSTCTVPGCWEHAEIHGCNTCTLSNSKQFGHRQQDRPGSLLVDIKHQQTNNWFYEKFLSQISCLKDLDIDEPHNSCFEHSHPQSSSYIQHQWLSPTDSSCKPCCLAWLCLSRLHAEAKNCHWSKNNDPCIWNNTVLTPSPTHRKKKNTSNEQPNLAKTLPYVVLASVYFPCWALWQKVVG